MAGPKTTSKAKPKRKKKQQRTRGTSPHPGVVLRKRTWASGKATWFARCRDPLTDRDVDINLSKLKPALTTAEARRCWAINKSKALAAERLALSEGRITREGPRAIDEAVEDYLRRARIRLRPRTVDCYAESLEVLKGWAADVGLRELRHLGAALLPQLRDHVAELPRRNAAKGGERGERRAATGPRSPASINRDLRHIKAFLNDARRRGMAPMLDGDAIREGLAAIRADRPRPPFLRPVAVAALLEAALRHDAQVFAMTREEKAAGRDGKPGNTPRHPPIAPLVLGAILSGCRIGELLGLRWDDVHLAGDAGELIVTATASKTRRERAVDLSVCPSLARLLAALRLRADVDAPVFGLTRSEAEAARKRLRRSYGAPGYTWQALRATCASYLACAPAIFGAASAYREAQQLGHSVQVAERNYIGTIRDIPADARTLEAALGIEELAGVIVAAAAGDRAATEGLDQRRAGGAS